MADLVSAGKLVKGFDEVWKLALIRGDDDQNQGEKEKERKPLQ